MIKPPVIDHEPKKAAGFIAIITSVVTIGAMIAYATGLRWVIDGLSDQALTAFFCGGFGLCVGLVIGSWDAKRNHSRTPGNDG